MGFLLGGENIKMNPCFRIKVGAYLSLSLRLVTLSIHKTLALHIFRDYENQKVYR